MPTRNIYDAIVVGARCAGSPTAMLLARAGLRVLMVDRCSFPSDTISTHYIHQLGIAKLKQWGLLDSLRKAGCPPIRHVSINSGPKVLQTFFMEFDTSVDSYCVRRTVLDQFLVEAAVASGVELREQFRLVDVRRDRGRVVGVRGRYRGAVIEERARLVIGADGANSLLAELVSAPRYSVSPMQNCYLYSYWRDLPVEGGEIFFRGGPAATVFPTNDGLTCVTLGWPRQRAAELKPNLRASYRRGLALFPTLHARLGRAQQAEGMHAWWGSTDNQFRRPFGPGWALVGDAGYHRDPLTALGITDAFRDAELLATAAVAGLSGKSMLVRALAGYERARNAAAEPFYNFTLEIASIGRARRDPRGRLQHAPGTRSGTAGQRLYLDDAVR